MSNYVFGRTGSKCTNIDVNDSDRRKEIDLDFTDYIYTYDK